MGHSSFLLRMNIGDPTQHGMRAWWRQAQLFSQKFQLLLVILYSVSVCPDLHLYRRYLCCISCSSPSSRRFGCWSKCLGYNFDIISYVKFSTAHKQTFQVCFYLVLLQIKKGKKKRNEIQRICRTFFICRLSKYYNCINSPSKKLFAKLGLNYATQAGNKESGEQITVSK